MKFSSTTVTIAAAAFVVTPTISNAASVTFLHINDHHSHFDEATSEITDPAIIPSAEELGGIETSRVRYRFGGAVRNVAYFRQQEANATAEGRSVVKVHAGDATTGTFDFTALGPEKDAAFMNMVGFHAFVLGNHEFDNGDSGAADLVGRLEFPALSANLNPAETSPLLDLAEEQQVKPYTIVDLGNNGDRLGICGITVKTNTEQCSFPDAGTTFDAERATAISCVADLEAQGINKILLLTHQGFGRDNSLFGDIDGVDIVIGGHSHSLLASPGFSSVGLGPRRGDYAVMENDKCMVQAWEYNKVVGRIDVEFDDAGVVTSCSGSPKAALNPDYYTVRDADPRFDLNATEAAVMTEALLAAPDSPFVVVEPDAEAAEVMAAFDEVIDAKRFVKIGSAADNICHTYTEQDELCADEPLENCFSGGVCNLVAAAFLDNVKTADIAIQNRGGCRTDILEGEITYGEAFEVLPYSNSLITVEMTGAEIKALLEEALNFFLDPEIAGSLGAYPFAAGLRYHLDFTADYGSRVSAMEVNSRMENEFTPIETDTTYTVATHSFLAAGRDGYRTFTTGSVASTYVDTGIEYGQAFVNFIENKEARGEALTTPALAEFSTQRLVSLDGTICEQTQEETSTAAPVATPTMDAPTPTIDTPTTDDSGSARIIIMATPFIATLLVTVATTAIALM